MTLTRENAIPDVGFKISQRAVRERFDELMREFKSKEANEKRASGITTKYDEIDQALLDIKERMEDAEQTMNCIKEKEQREHVAAEEMRKRATERLKETKRRAENKETDDGQGSQNKRAKRNDMVNLMKETLDRKKTDQDKERQTREKEIQTQQQMLLQQEQFQQQLLQNNQQLQQQQQAVNIVISCDTDVRGQSNSWFSIYTHSDVYLSVHIIFK